MNKPQRNFIILLLTLGTIAALFVGYKRVLVESSNPTVSLCVDYREAQRLAALTGISTVKQLEQLKSAGATHVALGETALGDMLTGRRVWFEYMQDDPSVNFMVPVKGNAPLVEALHAKLPSIALGEKVAQYMRKDGQVATYTYPVGTVESDPTIFLDMGVGYDPQALSEIKESGLHVVARPVPNYCLTKDAVDYSLKAAKDTGTKNIVFMGTSVLGSRELVKYAAEKMQELGLTFGLIELVPQDGESTMASVMKDNFIRVHSVSAEEMVQLSPDRALDRFVLAVTERKVRLCYIRLIFTGSADLGQMNSDYVGQVAGTLGKAGYSFGEPVPFGRPALPSSILVLVAFGVLGGLLWLVELLRQPPRLAFWALAGAGLLACIALPVASEGMTRTLLALGAGLIFPVIAMCLIDPVPENGNGRHNMRRLLAVGIVARTTLVTALGGLLAAAAMTDHAYLMKITQFRGVKLAQYIPLLVLFLIIAARASLAYRNTVKTKSRWSALMAGFADIGMGVVKYWHVGLIIFAVGAIGIMLMRSGNQPAIGASGTEMQLRALLDRLLVVRPRTKEIMLGYPMLFIGVMLLLRRQWRWYWPWLAGGTIAQVSVFNTFCHMHTPLLASLARVANGLWVGILAGIAVWLVKVVLERLWGWLQHSTPSPTHKEA